MRHESAELLVEQVARIREPKTGITFSHDFRDRMVRVLVGMNTPSEIVSHLADGVRRYESCHRGLTMEADRDRRDTRI